MKIAFFTDTYTPQINGVVVSINLFAEELRKLGHRVYIFCPKPGKKEKYVYRLPSFKFKPYPEYRGGVPVPSMLAIIKKIQPDVIHVHTPASIGFTGMIIAKYLKIPLVMTYHTLLEEYFKYFLLGLRGRKRIENLGEEIMKKYTKFFYNKADLVIAPSLMIRKVLKRCGVKKPIEVLPTGIRLKDFRRKRSSGKRTIIYVGRLGKEKSIDVVLRALRKILKKSYCKLIIVGDGPDRKRLEGLVKKLDIEGNVEFKNYIKHSDLIKSGLYNMSDVFVSASTTETQGLTVLEAFACGCPVIVANALGFRDFVKNGENGFLFKPGNAKELSEKIYRVITNKRLRKRLSENAKKTARLYDVKNSVKSLFNIYTRLIEQRNNPKVSIIIPALNEEKYIEKTLKHIKKQTYRNIEIIVVDNASTDKTKSIAKKYAKVISVKKRGISKARNAGARIATGSVLLFVDADTLLKKDFVERVVERFKKSKNVVGICGYIETRGSFLQRLVYKLCSEIAWISTIIRMPLFYGMCMAWKKDVFESVGGFDENLHTAEDIDFTIKARKFGRCILARDAKAITSPRRVVGMGLQEAVRFHIKNFFRHMFLKGAAKKYEIIR